MGNILTKEEILNKNLFNSFDDVDKETFLNAMEEYLLLHLKAIEEDVKEKAEIEFFGWQLNGCV